MHGHNVSFYIQMNFEKICVSYFSLVWQILNFPRLWIKWSKTSLSYFFPSLAGLYISVPDDIYIALLISRRFDYQMVLTVCCKSHKRRVVFYSLTVPNFLQVGI